MYITNLLNNIQKMQLPMLMSELSSEFADESHAYGEYPVLQIYSNGENLTIRAEVPGLTQEDISLSITDDVLTISGEIKGNPDFASVNFLRKERPWGKFQKTLELPTAVDGDKAQAAMKNGILMITLPIRESVKPKQITIKSE